MTKANIKVKINYPETEEGMKIFEEIKIESFYRILNGMIDKDGLKLLGDELKKSNTI